MDTISQFAVPGVIFILTLMFGLWLSYSGKPYNGILFNVHKLAALGSVIFTILQIYNMLKNTEIQTALIVLLIFAGMCVVALFASGAFMSIGKLDYVVLLTIHRVAIALGMIVFAVAIYLLNGRTL